VWDFKTYEMIDCGHIDLDERFFNDFSQFYISSSGVVTLGPRSAVYMALPNEIRLFDCTSRDPLQHFHIVSENERRWIFLVDPHFFPSINVDAGELQATMLCFGEKEMTIWSASHPMEEMLM
jgi:hypothetical protein